LHAFAAVFCTCFIRSIERSIAQRGVNKVRDVVFRLYRVVANGPVGDELSR